MKKTKYLLVYIWAVVILFLIGTPLEEYNGEIVTYYDKFAHAFVFGFFAFLLFNAKFDNHKRKIKSVFFSSLYYSTAFAAFGEIIQTVVPGRTESVLDFIAGLIGVVFFLSISAYVYSRKK